MFGFGNKRRRQARGSTFGGGSMRKAAMAGIGMLAWRWWKNRQSSGQSTAHQDRSFTENSSPAGGRF